jgi:quercetin dioxygenase-like cupin family protein
MKVAFFFALLGCAVAVAQAPAQVGKAELRKEILRNDRLNAYLIELKPGESAPMHRHDHDVLAVFITGGERKVTAEGGTPVKEKSAPGEVRFRAGGFAHATENIGGSLFRVVDVEFEAPQGKKEPPAHKRNHYCNPGSRTACVTEKYLFCTTKFCVEDVTMGPGAKSTQHSHDTEHMLVAISDYSLADDTVGKGVIQREVQSGGVEYLPAGINHVLTNTGKAEARFIAIIFK